jgi:hypothetical protein
VFAAALCGGSSSYHYLSERRAVAYDHQRGVAALQSAKSLDEARAVGERLSRATQAADTANRHRRRALLYLSLAAMFVSIWNVVWLWELRSEPRLSAS